MTFKYKQIFNCKLMWRRGASTLQVPLTNASLAPPQLFLLDVPAVPPAWTEPALLWRGPRGLFLVSQQGFYQAGVTKDGWRTQPATGTRTHRHDSRSKSKGRKSSTICTVKKGFLKIKCGRWTIPTLVQVMSLKKKSWKWDLPRPDAWMALTDFFIL